MPASTHTHTPTKMNTFADNQKYYMLYVDGQEWLTKKYQTLEEAKVAGALLCKKENVRVDVLVAIEYCTLSIRSTDSMIDALLFDETSENNVSAKALAERLGNLQNLLEDACELLFDDDALTSFDLFSSRLNTFRENAAPLLK